ncbi:pantoate--beta-alanine ligase [Terriglobus aquaticus]|uniref:Pantothenate synthetase n=1 Tax=Terriglobus aquaticus TaxID=940139 RepID=A0ABW9KGR1_9BACT|nr:pantoate--beta-alanine ligase [Terriglobus aquaticus]
MQIIHSISEMRSACLGLRSNGAELGLVPTMGALHAGHRSLVRAARETCRHVAVSIFVNPLQFAPGEDLESYPRTWEADLDLLQREGVDLVFAPSAKELYPNGTEAFVEVSAIGSRLDGASRPGHFRGVATVVAKLFHIVGPDHAFFGQKDAAQVAVLRAMIRALDFPVQMSVCPTVREEDGLAMSSRNRYLSPEERQQALALRASLDMMELAVMQDSSSVATVRSKWHAYLAAAPGVRLDYAELVDPTTLLPVEHLNAETLVAVAAWVGTTRLIDNVVLQAPRGIVR